MLVSHGKIFFWWKSSTSIGGAVPRPNHRKCSGFVVRRDRFSKNMRMHEVENAVTARLAALAELQVLHV